MAELAPRNLLEVSHDEAVMYQMADSEGFYTQEYEEQVLARLHDQTEAFSLDEQSYAIHANTALWLPRQRPIGEDVSIGLFYDLPLVARFDGFDAVHLPIGDGSRQWRMLCLAFEEVLLQPDGDLMPEAKMLRVPVLEVGKIACLGFGEQK